ncbi:MULTISPECIES: hypothetical protein [Thermoanaerobacterium]|uniref:Abortive infection protein n=2 Tax=Thermoanaerobacterium TaxID=28895 RepID=W9E894_9THEO|nr:MULTISPECIES: hypothetical protein [Thermoanaerobacterium]AFK85763.1 hypothetical protein Tsac_0741 [Thermoanaerobacterium saccharolyticum JW/SL-YS485]ETO38028.1 hypothetical protein V518_1894 [Thermoanaerobacterium aotearoense SCUT27]
MFIVGGFISAILSYFLNKLVVDMYGDKAVIYGVPLVEESSKTAIGYIFGSVIGVHFVFGVVEAFKDFVESPKEINFKASVLSIATHLVFGIVAFYVLRQINIYAAIFMTAVIHGCWNWIMLR